MWQMPYHIPTLSDENPGLNGGAGGEARSDPCRVDLTGRPSRLRDTTSNES